jgi:hypothetical protein
MFEKCYFTLLGGTGLLNEGTIPKSAMMGADIADKVDTLRPTGKKTALR